MNKLMKSGSPASMEYMLRKILDKPKNKYLIIIGLLLILVILWMPFFLPKIPTREESFFELAILGANNQADNYYPNNNPIIDIDEEVKWNIYLHNKMEKTKFVTLRIKLTNSTVLSPDSNKCIPAESPVIYEFTNGVVSNETLILPLHWSLNEASMIDGINRIDSIIINNDIIKVNVYNSNNTRFKFIIELWLFEENSDSFEFGWNIDDGKRCAWLQIWFEI